MTAHKSEAVVITPTKERLEAELHSLGLEPHWWSNAPGETYSRHSHSYHKVLFCLAGTIVFHTNDGDIELHPGDRLDVEPGLEHAASVGPQGVECVEGWWETR
jgi:mannose-6-phosphate isomerase-like protein (cupin superfamily)